MPLAAGARGETMARILGALDHAVSIGARVLY
jgi:hypothetical protein